MCISAMISSSGARGRAARRRSGCATAARCAVATRSPMPARPAKVRRAAAERFAEAREFGEAARDHRRARVVAGAEAVTHAGGDGDHVLQRAAELAADHVRVAVDAEQAGVNSAWMRWIIASSSMAITLAAAKPAMISRARFGTGQHARRVSGKFLADHLRHAHARALLEALRQADHRHPGADVLARLRTSVSRKVCDGTPITSTSACGRPRRDPPSRAASRQRRVRQVARVACALVHLDDRVGLRAQSSVGALRASSPPPSCPRIRRRARSRSDSCLARPRQEPFASPLPPDECTLAGRTSVSRD